MQAPKNEYEAELGLPVCISSHDPRFLNFFAVFSVTSY